MADQKSSRIILLRANISNLPAPKRILVRMLRGLILGLFVFGFGSVFTYGSLTGLMNEEQWRWTFLMCMIEVPIIVGVFVLWLPWRLYQPIHQRLIDWSHGKPVERKQCVQVYEQAVHLPRKVAISVFSGVAIGYLISVCFIRFYTGLPYIELAKALPAIPLVGGMMGAFCYFVTDSALQPVLSWCSQALRHMRPVRRIRFVTKFLLITNVLVVAVMCLLHPSAFTLGQVIVEQQLQGRVEQQLNTAAARIGSAEDLQSRLDILEDAVVGANGYVFAVDRAGRIVTPHPDLLGRVALERFDNLNDRFTKTSDVWMNRIGAHRVVALVRLESPEWTLFSVALPKDFSTPLSNYFQFSLIVLIQVLLVVLLFGRYYSKSITKPLDQMTEAAEKIAKHGDLTKFVPMSATDELSRLSTAFNRMVEQLHNSQMALKENNKYLQQSRRELAYLNQDMEELLHIVSHDLRAPLINVQGFSHRLERTVKDMLKQLDALPTHSSKNGLREQITELKAGVQTRMDESMKFITIGVEKIDTLLTSLLEVSRVGRKADSMEPHDLNVILDDVLATLDHQLNERGIEVKRHPLPKAVPCRRNEINQVYSNLISNAIRYMSTSKERVIEIGANENVDSTECYVRDTGIGIDPDDHDKIFKMFTRLQTIEAEGEGVGLAYVKKILQSHGGSIRVESKLGGGSTFFFTLPKVTKHVTKAAAATTGEQPTTVTESRSRRWDD